MSPKKGVISVVDTKSIKEEPSEEPKDALPLFSQKQEESNAGQDLTYRCPIRMNFTTSRSLPGKGLACMIQVSIANLAFPLSVKLKVKKLDDLSCCFII